jgi:hypothetical protein
MRRDLWQSPIPGSVGPLHADEGLLFLFVDDGKRPCFVQTVVEAISSRGISLLGPMPIVRPIPRRKIQNPMQLTLGY